MPVGHRCPLSPYGHWFWKRVCARGLEPDGWLPGLGPSQQWPPMPSHAAIQAGQAGSKGPLAAQPGSCHGAWGPAGHNPLAAAQPCPAELATQGAAQPSQGGLPARASVVDGTWRRGGGGTPGLFTASTVLAASRCSAHSVYKAAGSMPGGWHGLSNSCEQCHHYYYPQQPWVN